MWGVFRDSVRGRGVVRGVTLFGGVAWCEAWRGVVLGAWRGVARRGVASTIPRFTVFEGTVGLWVPKESRTKSNDIHKKMVRCTLRRLLEI